MPRATIRANANVAGLARGETAEVELDRRTLNRAAAGTISIIESTPPEHDDEPAPAGDEQPADDEIEGADDGWDPGEDDEPADAI